MNTFLYHTFIHWHNKGDIIISFNKIKRVLSQNINDFENNKTNFNSLFQLLKLGLIDKSGKNSYSLSPSSLITYASKNSTLGINLPSAIISKNKDLVIDSYLGLTLFKGIHIDSLEYDLIETEFCFDSSISQLNPIHSIISKWEPVEFYELGKIIKLEIYNPINNKWSNTNEINRNNTLYKIYIHNQFNYSYAYFYKNKYFKLEKEDYEKVNSLKLLKGNKAFLKYNQELNLLYLKRYFTYPVYLYKLLFLNHIMNKGEFPLNNQFEIKEKHFTKITKKLTLNYENI